MDFSRRQVTAVVVLVALGTALALVNPGPVSTNPLLYAQSYPDGAGPNHVDVAALIGGDDTPSAHTPGDAWETYVVRTSISHADAYTLHTTHYIDSLTGERLTHTESAAVGYAAMEYANATTYAFVYPNASDINDSDTRENLEETATYDPETDAYYIYDENPDRYAADAPTAHITAVVGGNDRLLEQYTWKAVGTTTQHGVAVITYRLTGRHPAYHESAEPAEGTLLIGVEHGVIYAYDIRVDSTMGQTHYQYRAMPADFPGHDWVSTAAAVANEGDQG